MKKPEALIIDITDRIGAHRAGISLGNGHRAAACDDLSGGRYGASAGGNLITASLADHIAWEPRTTLA